jgi:hypothetical protein
MLKRINALGKATYPFVSIIILNFNGLQYVEKCLKSVMQSDYPSFEVLFVDNNSVDGSLEYARQLYGHDRRLKVISNRRNYGYAGGNNRGATHANGDYLVFLNIDTVVQSDWLSRLIGFLESHSGAGIVQCKLKMMDNPRLIDCAGHCINWFGVAFVRGHGHPDEGQYDMVEHIFGAGGAAFATRRDLFWRLGGFDEDFFMLFEEDDLCWRAWLSGWSVFYVPDAVVYHKGGPIRSKEGEYLNLYFSRRNRLISMLKNYSVRNLLRFFPVSLTLLFAITFLTRDKKLYLMAFLKSLLWILNHPSEVMLKRRIVDRARLVSDDYLIAEGIIRKPVLREILEHGY